MLLFAMLTLSAGPEPAVAAELTAAAAAYRANLAAFPTLTMTQTRRIRRGKTADEVLAAAPATPDQTSTLRLVRHAGRQRVTLTADPASRKRLADTKPALDPTTGLVMGPVVDSMDGGQLTDDTGRHADHMPFQRYVAMSAKPVDYNDRDSSIDTVADVLRGGPQEAGPRDLPACVAAALAGRVTAAVSRSPAGRPVYTFTGAEGEGSFEVDPARGHLPVRIRSARTGGDPAARSSSEFVVELRACTGGRWFPGRVAMATVLPASRVKTGSAVIGLEYVVTELDADTPPPAADLQLVLPAGTRVHDDDGPPGKLLVLAADTTVGPDDLAGLQERTVVASGKTRDRRVVGGDGRTPAERRSRQLWVYGGIATLVVVAVGLVVRRVRR